MALDRRRCPGGDVLKALAADGLESGRYGMQGDKELYRLAWESVGCSVAYLPFPGVAGFSMKAATETEGISMSGSHFYGMGLLHRSPDGRHLGVHWAWGKLMLQRLVPKL